MIHITQAHHSSEYFTFQLPALRQKWNNSGEILMWGSAATDGLPLIGCSARSLNLDLPVLGAHRATDRLPRWFELSQYPKSHRVHHEWTRCGLDKNYGGILIIRDCLFGSFQPGAIPTAYGPRVDDVLTSWKLQTREYVAIVRDCGRQHVWVGLPSYVFRPPTAHHRNPMPLPPVTFPWNVANSTLRKSITVGFWHALAVTGRRAMAWPRRMGVRVVRSGTTRIAATVAPLAAGFRRRPPCRSGLGVPGMEIRQTTRLHLAMSTRSEIAFTAGIVGAGERPPAGTTRLSAISGLGQHTSGLHCGHARADRRLRGDCAG